MRAERPASVAWPDADDAARASRSPLVHAAHVATLVVAIDAIAKSLAVSYLAGGAVPLPGPLSLSLVYNDTFGRGMDLGGLTAIATFGMTLVFVALVAITCAALARHDARAPRALGLVAGAAVANAIDFLHTGRGAIDFLAVETASGAVVFNLADVAAYAGVVLLAGTTLVLGRAIVAERHAAAAAEAEGTAAVARAERRAHERRARERATGDRRSRVVGEWTRAVPVFVEPSAARGAAEDAAAPLRAPMYPPRFGTDDVVPLDGPADVAAAPNFER